MPSQHKHLCSLLRKWFSWNIICTSNIIIIFLAGMAPQSNLFRSPTHNCASMVEGEPDKDKQPRGGRERRRKERGKCLPEPELQINEFCAKPNPQRSKINSCSSLFTITISSSVQGRGGWLQRVCRWKMKGMIGMAYWLFHTHWTYWKTLPNV